MRRRFELPWLVSSWLPRFSTAWKRRIPAAIQRRLAKGAKVLIQEVGEKDLTNLRDLLTIYADELKHNHQAEESQKVLNMLVDWKNTFVRVVPLGQQEEQRFATE